MLLKILSIYCKVKYVIESDKIKPAKDAKTGVRLNLQLHGNLK